MGNQESTSTVVTPRQSSDVSSPVSDDANSPECTLKVPSRLSPLFRKSGGGGGSSGRFQSRSQRRHSSRSLRTLNQSGNSTIETRISACGQNSRGQFGMAIDEMRNQRTSASFALCTCEWSLYIKDVSQVACGRDFTVLLCRSGDCFSCGSNDVGQLGLGGRQVTAMRNFDSPMAVRVLSEQLRAGATDVSAYSQRRSASLSSLATGVAVNQHRRSLCHCYWKSSTCAACKSGVITGRSSSSSSSSSGSCSSSSSTSMRAAQPSVHRVSTNPSGKCVMYLTDLNQDLIVKSVVSCWVRRINEALRNDHPDYHDLALDTASSVRGREESQSFYEFMQEGTLISEDFGRMKSTPRLFNQSSRSEKSASERGRCTRKRRRIWRVKGRGAKGESAKGDTGADSSLDNEGLHGLTEECGSDDSSGEMYRKFYCYSSGSHSDSRAEDNRAGSEVYDESDSKGMEPNSEINDDRMSGLSSVHSDFMSELDRGYNDESSQVHSMKKPHSGNSISESSWRDFRFRDAVKSLAKTAILQDMDYGGGMDSLREAFGNPETRIKTAKLMDEDEMIYLPLKNPKMVSFQTDDSVISDTSMNVDREYNVCAVGTGVHGYGLTPSLSGMVGDPSRSFQRLDSDLQSQSEFKSDDNDCDISKDGDVCSSDDDVGSESSSSSMSSSSSFIPPLYVPSDVVSVICKYVRLGVVSVSGCLFDSSRLNSFFPTPIRRPFLTQRISIVSTAVGFNHALFLTERGNVFSYGMNTVGQTGLSSPRVVSQATRVKFPKMPVDFDETFNTKSLSKSKLYSTSITDDGSDLSADSRGKSLDIREHSARDYYSKSESNSCESSSEDSSSINSRGEYVDYESSEEESSSDGGFLFMRKWRKKRGKKSKSDAKYAVKQQRRRRRQQSSSEKGTAIHSDLLGRMSSYSRTGTTLRTNCSSSSNSNSSYTRSGTMSGWDPSSTVGGWDESTAESSLMNDNHSEQPRHHHRQRPKIEQICAGSHFSLALDTLGRVWFFGMISAHQWQLNLYAGDSDAQKLKRKELSRPRLLDFVTEVKSPLGGPFAPMCGDLFSSSPEKTSSPHQSISDASFRSFSKLDADYLEFYCGRRTLATPVRSGATDDSAARSTADATSSTGSAGSTTIQRLKRSLKLGLSGSKNVSSAAAMSATAALGSIANPENGAAKSSSLSGSSSSSSSSNQCTDSVMFEIANDKAVINRSPSPRSSALLSAESASGAAAAAVSSRTRSTATKSNSFGKKQVREWTKRTFAFATRSLSTGSTNRNQSSMYQEGSSPKMTVNDDTLFGLDPLDGEEFADESPPHSPLVGIIGSSLKNGQSAVTLTSVLSRLGQVRHRIVSMDCGEHHAAFVSVYGSVFTIGRNDYGQLGVGSGAMFADKAQHVYVLSNEVVEQVSCGRDHCAALTESSANTIHVWGSNQCGQCMTDGPRKIFYPKPITADIQPLLAGSQVLDVFCGNKYTFVAHT